MIVTLFSDCTSCGIYLEVNLNMFLMIWTVQILFYTNFLLQDDKSFMAYIVSVFVHRFEYALHVDDNS